MISAIVAQAAKFAASRGGAAGGDQQVRQPAAAACASPTMVGVDCSQPSPCKQTGGEGSRTAEQGPVCTLVPLPQCCACLKPGSMPFSSRMQQT